LCDLKKKTVILLQSEYLAACDLRRSFISGFTGSAGTAVITTNKAALWTDGRYFLQVGQLRNIFIYNSIEQWFLTRETLGDFKGGVIPYAPCNMKSLINKLTNTYICLKQLVCCQGDMKQKIITKRGAVEKRLRTTGIELSFQSNHYQVPD